MGRWVRNQIKYHGNLWSIDGHKMNGFEKTRKSTRKNPSRFSFTQSWKCTPLSYFYSVFQTRARDASRQLVQLASHRLLVSITPLIGGEHSSSTLFYQRFLSFVIKDFWAPWNIVFAQSDRKISTEYSYINILIHIHKKCGSIKKFVVLWQDQILILPPMFRCSAFIYVGFESGWRVAHSKYITMENTLQIISNQILQENLHIICTHIVDI